MAFIKKGIPTETVTKPESVCAPVITPTHVTVTKYRDFDAEARGKTRCALEEAWAQSPLLPMLVKDPSNHAEVHALLDEIVTERMKRVFPNG